MQLMYYTVLRLAKYIQVHCTDFLLSVPLTKSVNRKIINYQGMCWHNLEHISCSSDLLDLTCCLSTMLEKSIQSYMLQTDPMNVTELKAVNQL